MSAEIEVWRASLREGTEEAALLSPAELARAAGYRRERDRHRFVRCRTVLRRLLARKTGIAPEALEIVIAPDGKPFIANAPLHFSISHAAGLLLVAVSPEAEVGVDIEWMDPGVDFLPVAARNFTWEQYTRLREAHGQRRVRLFYRFWTVREAWMKAWGCEPDAGEARLAPVRVPRGYMAALAIRAKGNAVSQVGCRGHCPLPEGLGGEASQCLLPLSKAGTEHLCKPAVSG